MQDVMLMLESTGESEYWFALIKVLLVVVFVIVGLIYDWGGVRGHPGPVRSHSRQRSPERYLVLITAAAGSRELPRRTSFRGRL